jgi:hypothetical protein
MRTTPLRGDRPPVSGACRHGEFLLKPAALALGVALLSCVPRQDDWRLHQDRTIKVPRFDGSTKIDLVIDGPVLQALRIAADDFLPPGRPPRACGDTQAAYVYEVSRDRDLIFIQIAENPRYCGGRFYALDGAVRYAISMDGRILRRVSDGEPDGWEEADASPAHPSVELPLRPDGGGPILDMGVHWNRSLTPQWLTEGGAPDGGVPDGGTPGPADDAGVPGTWGSGQPSNRGQAR